MYLSSVSQQLLYKVAKQVIYLELLGKVDLQKLFTAFLEYQSTYQGLTYFVFMRKASIDFGSMLNKCFQKKPLQVNWYCKMLVKKNHES